MVSGWPDSKSCQMSHHDPIEFTLIAANDEAVTFKYTDSATQQKKVCAVSAEEFLRRYLQHVPPPGQPRVRYFGWLHPSAKARFLTVQTVLAVPIIVTAAVPPETQWHLRCSHCEAFALVVVGTLPRHARAPPVCSQ